MAFLNLRIPPPLVALTFAIMMWFLSKFGPEIQWRPVFAHASSAILIAMAIVFDVFALIAFWSSKTTINPLRPESTSSLVTSGIYKITRNPMYVGLALFLLAWAVYLSSFMALMCIPFFIAYIHRFQIVCEEKVLMQRFGRAFEEYKAKVRPWL